MGSVLKLFTAVADVDDGVARYYILASVSPREDRPLVRGDFSVERVQDLPQTTAVVSLGSSRTHVGLCELAAHFCTA